MGEHGTWNTGCVGQGHGTSVSSNGRGRIRNRGDNVWGKSKKLGKQWLKGAGTAVSIEE